MIRLFFHSFGRSAQQCARTIPLFLSFGFFSCSSPQKTLTAVPPPTIPSPIVVPNNNTAWRLTPPKPGNPGHFSYPSPVIKKLRNGLTLYVLERPSGPAALSVVVAEGASVETPRRSGLASLTLELMAEATKRHSHYLLSEAAESLGSTLIGDASRDSVHLSIDTLPEDVPQGLALLAEVLREPAFELNDFQRLQKQKLDELRAERQSPTRLASLVGLRTLLGPNLGNPVGGCPQSVRNLKLADVKQWYQETIIPSSTAVVVVGPVAAEQVHKQVDEIFGGWTSRKLPPPKTRPLPSPPKGRTLYLLDRPDSVQSALFVAQQFPKRQTAGFIAREHLDNILGGLFTSRINQNLRETHAYTYGARSSVIAARDFGLFTCSTSVATEVTVNALTEILTS